MKTLLLIRHGKSSWDSVSSTDAERPLSSRGKHDAPMMARRLLKNKVNIDLFVSSPAKRARKTAEYFLEEYARKEKELILVPELYEASNKNFSSVVSLLDDKIDDVAVISHNPGITDFANHLTEVKIDNMPTCSVFAVKSDVKNWSEFIDGKKDFWFFEYPKKEMNP